MYLKILTLGKSIFEGEIQKITLPGSMGSFQILRDHAPIVSSLTKGPIFFKEGTKEHTMAIESGVVEVRDNVIVILVEVNDA